nr:reverse transcriptase domain-containing protein [Tanacetum cinerariifolium]
MMIEHYFLLTNYSLWEVILNGDSCIPTRVIEGVVQPVALTTAKQRLARKNELKAHEILGESLSQEDINLKFLRSLPTEWRTHTLIWRNKTDLEDQSLDDLFNILKIYEAEVKSSSSASTSTQNITFMSSQNTDSTNESVSDVASVSTASAKIPVSALPNVDTLSNATNAIWIMQRTCNFLKMRDGNFPRYGERLYRNVKKPTLCSIRTECRFMVKEGIVLGLKISWARIKVDRAKINVIAKLPYPINVKRVRSFLGHAGFYRRTENLVADYLSRLENPNLGVFTEEEIAEEFPNEHLMMLKAKLNDDEPWYPDYVNYIVGKIVPPR